MGVFFLISKVIVIIYNSWEKWKPSENLAMKKIRWAYLPHKIEAFNLNSHYYSTILHEFFDFIDWLPELVWYFVSVAEFHFLKCLSYDSCMKIYITQLVERCRTKISLFSYMCKFFFYLYIWTTIKYENSLLLSFVDEKSYAMSLIPCVVNNYWYFFIFPRAVYSLRC